MPETPPIDTANPDIKQELLALIAQYLHDEGLHASVGVLQDELGIRRAERRQDALRLKQLTQHVLDGEWGEVERMLAPPALPLLANPEVQYALHRQSFYECMERNELQKAMAILGKRLRPLEHCAPAGEFKELCYVMTTRTVPEGLVRGWTGAAAGRERLVRALQSLYTTHGAFVDEGATAPQPPPRRLEQLVEQAAAFQLAQSGVAPRPSVRVTTLLSDFYARLLPNARHRRFSGHEANVKCVAFVGDRGTWLASGSSDATARVWHVASGRCAATLPGHRGRVWAVAATQCGSLLATGSGDGAVRLFDARPLAADDDAPGSLACVRTLEAASPGPAADAAGLLATTLPRCGSSSGRPRAGSASEAATGAATPASAAAWAGILAESAAAPESAEPLSTRDSSSAALWSTASAAGAALRAPPTDVYSVQFSPDGSLIAAGGYERQVRLYDVATGTLLRRMTGHALGIAHIAWSASGHILATGSKDASVRFWDARSGICVMTLKSYLAEVTSVDLHQDGVHLLTGAKDNANRLWDLRSLGRPLRRYRGHQNTFANFVKAALVGPDLVLGGSEDGHVYLWDRASEAIVQQWAAHGTGGVSYQAVWSPSQQLYASCGNDWLVKTWQHRASS